MATQSFFGRGRSVVSHQDKEVETACVYLHVPRSYSTPQPFKHSSNPGDRQPETWAPGYFSTLLRSTNSQAIFEQSPRASGSGRRSVWLRRPSRFTASISYYIKRAGLLALGRKFAAMLLHMDVDPSLSVLPCYESQIGNSALLVVLPLSCAPSSSTPALSSGRTGALHQHKP
jgi:hypothetical protein